MKWSPKRILILVIALALARFVLPLALASWHYSSTPDFRTCVREQPTDDQVWQDVVPDGVELGRGLPWRSNDTEPGPRRGVWLATTRVEHGDELLLDLELEIAFESSEVEDWLERDVPSEQFEALAVQALRTHLDPDFHAVVVLTLWGLGDPQHSRGPNAQLDAFALAGPGELELIVRQASGGAPGTGESLLGGGFSGPGAGFLVRMILGIAFPLGGPPDEGLAYHLRADFHPTWGRTKGGSSGGGFGPWEFGGTSTQYSYRMAGKTALQTPFNEPGFFGSTTESHVEGLYTWSGDVW